MPPLAAAPPGERSMVKLSGLIEGMHCTRQRTICPLGWTSQSSCASLNVTADRQQQRSGPAYRPASPWRPLQLQPGLLARPRRSLSQRSLPPMALPRIA